MEIVAIGFGAEIGVGFLRHQAGRWVIEARLACVLVGVDVVAGGAVLWHRGSSFRGSATPDC